MTLCFAGPPLVNSNDYNELLKDIGSKALINVEDPTTQILVSLSSNPFSEINGRILKIEVLRGESALAKYKNKSVCEEKRNFPHNLKYECANSQIEESFNVFCLIRNLEPSTNYT